MSLDIVYYSNRSENTKRFVEKITDNGKRIPIDYDSHSDSIVNAPYILCVPTYGGGREASAIPRQVREFLNVPKNRELLRGVIGFGNTNFGEHYCKAAEMICSKTGVPLIARVEIFGTENDVNKVQERLAMLNDISV